MAEHGSFDESAVAPAPGLQSETLPERLPADPFPLLSAWYEDAHRREAPPNPNAMTLATVDPDGRPSARIVLCKGISAEAGAVVFFTNYRSRKGAALEANPWGAVVWHWDALDRQARVEGRIAKVSESESDDYFALRPWQSRIGAWSSEQSRPIGSRRELLERIEATMRRFGLDPASPPRAGDTVKIPRPAHWGGYRLTADRVELWASGRGRVHDRAQWTRTLPAGAWAATRLQP
jgi:pyridoxamine 5'-phosphate oxidase